MSTFPRRLFNCIAVAALIVTMLHLGVSGISIAPASAQEQTKPTASVPVVPLKQQAPSMTPQQAIDLVDRWRQVAVLPQSSLRDHIQLQEAVGVLRAFVTTLQEKDAPVLDVKAEKVPANK